MVAAMAVRMPRTVMVVIAASEPVRSTASAERSGVVVRRESSDELVAPSDDATIDVPRADAPRADGATAFTMGARCLV